MRKIREIRSLPVLAFIAVDDSGQEWLIDYDRFNEGCAHAVTVGYAATLEEAENESLAEMTPDMDCVIRAATDED